MYSNNADQAIGFAGLRLYVSDIEAVLDSCRSAKPRAAVSDFDETLVAEIWQQEPALHVPPASAAAEPALAASIAAEPASPRPSRIPPVALSIAAIVVASVMSVVLLRSFEKHDLAVPETGSLQSTEEPPPLGRGLLLKPPQIRYCIAQGIRLGSAAEHAEGLSVDDAAQLQSMFDDYEGRCAEYRFQAGAFDAARRDVETRRAVLEHEGLQIFAARQSRALAAAPAREQPSAARLEVVQGEAPQVEDQPMREVSGMADRNRVIDRTPRKYIKDLQWRLFKLKYYAGPIDGIDSQAMQDALRGFFSVHDQAVDSGDERAIFRAVDSIYQQR